VEPRPETTLEQAEEGGLQFGPVEIVKTIAELFANGEDEAGTASPARVWYRSGVLRRYRGAHILTRDMGQLAGQLTGRLRGLEPPKIAALVARIESQARRPWLSPQTRSLMPPGGPRNRIIIGHRRTIAAVAVAPGGTRAVSASKDRTLRLWDVVTGEEVCRFLCRRSNSVRRLRCAGSIDGAVHILRLMP
jgi:WD40 repeat protein